MDLNSSTCGADYAQAHNNLGIELRSRGALEDAARSFKRALALRPDYTQAHYNLAVTLQDQGESEEALVSYRNALTYKPDHVEALYNIGEVLCDLEQFDAATLHLHRCLESDPEDRLGAEFFLAGLKRAPTPKAASRAFLQRLYAQKAKVWDGMEGYCAHEMVATALLNSACTPKQDVLDAGCGTGLVGSLIGSIAKRLDGIDLSPAMLKVAYEKGQYSLLYEGDMISFLQHNADCYDAITSAGTLIHFARLEPLFDAAAISLRRGGLFVFTAFSNDEVDKRRFAVSSHLGLAKGGCFAHGSEYIADAAKCAGFCVETFELGVLERRPGTEVSGFVVTLRRV